MLEAFSTFRKRQCSYVPQKLKKVAAIILQWDIKMNKSSSISPPKFKLQLTIIIWQKVYTFVKKLTTHHTTEWNFKVYDFRGRSHHVLVMVQLIRTKRQEISLIHHILLHNLKWKLIIFFFHDRKISDYRQNISVQQNLQK